MAKKVQKASENQELWTLVGYGVLAGAALGVTGYGWGLLWAALAVPGAVFGYHLLKWLSDSQEVPQQKGQS
jgi:hypothetical protein